MIGPDDSMSKNAAEATTFGCLEHGLIANIGEFELGLAAGYGSRLSVGNPQTFPLRMSITTLPNTWPRPSGARSMVTPGSTKKGEGSAD